MDCLISSTMVWISARMSADVASKSLVRNGFQSSALKGGFTVRSEIVLTWR
jgi:hypothetical protein